VQSAVGGKQHTLFLWISDRQAAGSIHATWLNHLEGCDSTWLLFALTVTRDAWFQLTPCTHTPRMCVSPNNFQLNSRMSLVCQHSSETRSEHRRQHYAQLTTEHFFRPHRMHWVHRCGLVLTYRDLTGCWSRWEMQKRRNPLDAVRATDSHGHKEPITSYGEYILAPSGKHAQTWCRYHYCNNLFSLVFGSTRPAVKKVLLNSAVLKRRQKTPLH